MWMAISQFTSKGSTATTSKAELTSKGQESNHRTKHQLPRTNLARSHQISSSSHSPTNQCSEGSSTNTIRPCLKSSRNAQTQTSSKERKQSSIKTWEAPTRNIDGRGVLLSSSPKGRRQTPLRTTGGGETP